MPNSWTCCNAEPAHYRALATLPAAGLWQITAIQGVFAPFEVGALNLPGRLAAYPVPPATDDHQHGTHWTNMRPPGFCAADTHPAAPTNAVAMAADAPRSSANDRFGNTVMLVVLVGTGLLLGVAVSLVVAHRRRSRTSLP